MSLIELGNEYKRFFYPALEILNRWESNNTNSTRENNNEKKREIETNYN